MKRSRFILTALAALVVAAGWYAFRPERAFIDVRVAEAAPPPPSVVVAHGSFRPLAHKGEGNATLIRTGDGAIVVRLSDFATLNGPDVRVYLLGAASVRGRDELEVAGYVDLGPLKGNIGDQNYALPPGTDLTKVKAVSVWCRRFGVNFTSAALSFDEATRP